MRPSKARRWWAHRNSATARSKRPSPSSPACNGSCRSSMDDAKALVLAKAGRIDFVNPRVPPSSTRSMQAGWTKLVDIGDLYKYGPGGLDSPVEPLVASVGIGANAEFVNTNQNDVLRFLSVVWRTIDEVQKDPSLFELQAPYLNSVAGTDLDGKGVEATVKALDPLSPFDYDKTYYVDASSVLYYRNAWGRSSGLREHGIVPKGAVTPDHIIWAAAIWHQMVDYRHKPTPF